MDISISGTREDKPFPKYGTVNRVPTKLSKEFCHTNLGVDVGVTTRFIL